MTDKYGKIHTDGSRSGGQPLNDSIEPKEVFRNKAIALINEYRQQRGLMPIQFLEIITPEISAFIRSIQLHEKTKQEFADFKQEVSDAVQSWVDGGIDRPAYLWFRKKLEQFIIPKPKLDPLEEVLREIDHAAMWVDECAKEIRASLEARGLEIREKNDD
jgi:hypothetical protein